jgi:hypothetical protein
MLQDSLTLEVESDTLFQNVSTLLLSVNVRKNKILEISAVEVSNQIYLSHKLKITTAYLFCYVAAFESTMLTSAASNMILP